MTFRKGIKNASRVCKCTSTQCKMLQCITLSRHPQVLHFNIWNWDIINCTAHATVLYKSALLLLRSKLSFFLHSLKLLLQTFLITHPLILRLLYLHLIKFISSRHCLLPRVGYDDWTNTPKTFIYLSICLFVCLSFCLFVCCIDNEYDKENKLPVIRQLAERGGTAEVGAKK